MTTYCDLRPDSPNSATLEIPLANEGGKDEKFLESSIPWRINDSLSLPANGWSHPQRLALNAMTFCSSGFFFAFFFLPVAPGRGSNCLDDRKSRRLSVGSC
jgi:hypothetical protein